MISLWRRKPAEEPQETIDLGPMPSIFDRPAPPPLPVLSVNEMFPPCWVVEREDGGRQARLRFMPDGRVLGGPEDAHWELVDGRLTISRNGGAIWTFGARENVSGRLMLRGVDAAGLGALMMPDLDDLHMVAVLRRPSAPLTIVFNSDQNPFREEETIWEFADHLSSNDFVLFAEEAEPSFGYLNKTVRVLERLRMLPEIGYREFLFLGQGSGGYAAIMFAEMLGYASPGVRIVSVTCNPVTAIGGDHDEAVREAAVDATMRPALPDADALTQKDCACTAIRDLVRMNQRKRGTRVTHRILYDAHNPAQAYYAKIIGDVTGFEYQPLALGLPPGEGCRMIAGSDLLTQSIAWARRDWRAWDADA